MGNGPPSESLHFTAQSSWYERLTRIRLRPLPRLLRKRVSQQHYDILPMNCPAAYSHYPHLQLLRRTMGNGKRSWLCKAPEMNGLGFQALPSECNGESGQSSPAPVFFPYAAAGLFPASRMTRPSGHTATMAASGRTRGMNPVRVDSSFPGVLSSPSRTMKENSAHF